MNKTAIKNFAIWARNKLIADIQYRAGLMGITADGIKDPLPQSTGTMEFYDIGTSEPYAISGDAIPQRKKLAEVIRRKEKDSNYATAYKYILEEVAYTWFNRLIAIRFMEVNDYLPSRIRVLSSESGKIEPDLVTTPFDAELTFTHAEEETVLRLKNENKLDELFRLLFIKQCNALNEILPALFEKTSDYTELLLNLSVVDQEGVVYHLIHDIAEDDFNIEKGGQVEIIGWLYQYYNTEPKNAAFAKNGKITKEEIPAVTQLFTPDWIVRYMVENSLGRIFIDKRKEQGVFADGLAPEEMTWDEIEAKRIANEEEIAGQMGWKYYLPEAAQTKEVRQQLDEIQKQSEYKDVRDIKVIDPCMGSGHILVYAFDVLMQMYENDGYSQRDAAHCILEHNLFGLDIDERAAQLAYFAVMMKARQYDRRIFSRGIQPHVYAIAESNDIDTYTRDYFANNDPKLKAALDSIINDLRDAKEYGSILTVAPVDFAALYARVEEVQNDISLHREAALATILPLILVAEVLAQQYDVVVTNPPYMSLKGMPKALFEYVMKNHSTTKNDIYCVFIEKCLKQYAKAHGYVAMITQQVWMFTSGFEKFRKDLLANYTISSLIQLGTKAFEDISGEVVQTCTFIIKSDRIAKSKTNFFRLVDENSSSSKENAFLARKERYEVSSEQFSAVPGAPICYWLSDKIFKIYQTSLSISDVSKTRQGLKSSDDKRFIRFFYEVSVTRIAQHIHSTTQAASSLQKWFWLNKGGQIKWFGNNIYVINWEHDGKEIKDYAVKVAGSFSKNITAIDAYFKECLSWPQISLSHPSFRYIPKGFIFASAGPSLFVNDPTQKWYVLGLLNSCVTQTLLDAINPTINFGVSDILKIPFIFDNHQQGLIEKLVIECVKIAKYDYDQNETSWEFLRHPLVQRGDDCKISVAFIEWTEICNNNFSQLKSNEENLNAIFANIYGLTDELVTKVKDEEVSIHKANLEHDIKSLLSYAVGCMFGRYSLDVDGLAYAGGDWDASKYKTFLPDQDDVIPITDEEYLEDDIISRLCDWLKAAYGADTLEENLDFIAGALGGKGNSSREIIRSYFLKDFFKDHCKTYQKRPIYWLFDSGKQNGFKALIYLHRYTPDTIGNLRVDYLHKMQRVYESEINRMQDMIDHSTNAREVAASTKRKEKLQKQLKECRDYDEMIAHLALSRIELDLDDGVKVNYEKIQTASDGKKYVVLAKI